MSETATQLTKLVGKTVMVAVDRGAFRVAVEIIDAKQSYGNTRYLVRPVGGDGEAWVDAGRIQTDKKA